MHKQIRIINASLSGQSSQEPGCYSAFTLGPLLSASTAGTPGASWRPPSIPAPGSKRQAGDEGMLWAHMVAHGLSGSRLGAGRNKTILLL